MSLVIVLFIAGILLSAFFSGAETGFYRVARVRLLIDGVGGDWIARGLLWLTNHPSLYIATTLVGNNVANYLVSLSVVIGTRLLYGGQANWPVIVAPVLLSPIVFVYGELLPKNVFFEAPNRLLHRSGPWLLLCTVLFLPVTGVLWALSKLLQWIVGESPQKMQLVLARRELEQVFEEGHETGILGPALGGLSQAILDTAGQSVLEVATAAGRVPKVQTRMSKAEICRVARRNRLTAVPVEDPAQKGKLIGYLRVADLYLDESDELPPLWPIVDVPDTDTYISALMRLQASTEMLGRVVTQSGQTVGFVTARQLGRPLLRAK